MENRNTRGSEWRRWDLHIHTPNTGKNDNFKVTGDENIWDKYITNLEAHAEFAVLGITDYFSIDNYLRVKNEQNNGRLQKQYLIPNVELRILPVTSTDTPINLHVLFDPNLDENVIKRDFFNKLKFDYAGSSYLCTRSDIIELGRKFENNSNLAEDSAYKRGINQFNISFSAVKEALQSNSLYNKFLVGVSNSRNDGNSGIQDSALSAVREEIYRLSDFIFSANPNDILYFLGKREGADSPEQIIEKYGSLKPCIKGCDAHSFDRMFQYKDNRFTWIKSNPTFEGLKQIIYEPEERVKIQENIPEEKNDYQIIDSISFDNEEMGKQEIKFNQNLNTVIGGRSSGKSILLGCLASKIDPKITPKNSEMNRKYNETISKLNAGVSVKWRDNTEETRKIIYYSQSAISEKVRENEYGISGISGLVKDIVKKEPEKLELIQSYEKFLVINKGELNTKINNFCQIKAQIENINNQIDNIGNKTGIDSAILKIQKEIDSIKKNIKGYLSEIEDKKYRESKTKIEEYERNIELIKSDNAQLQLIKNAELFSSQETSFSKLSDTTNESIVKFYDELKSKTKEEWIKFIGSQIDEKIKAQNDLSKNVQTIKGSELYKKGESFKDSNKLLEQKSQNLDFENKKKNEIIQLETEIKKLEVSRNQLVSDIWNCFSKYEKEAKTLSGALRTQRDEVEIQASVKFIYKEFFEQVIKLLNKKNPGAKKYEDYESFDLLTLENYVNEIFDGIISGNLPLIKTNFQQALIDLFSNNYYTISYDVVFDGDNFSEMSEGKKAFIALRLLLDFDDGSCPIIIDQPEDDLDNRAIYDQLVMYLRKQKKNRQIILATHNPNIVVGADAELVIVANQNGLKNKNQDNVQFEYYANSIEDSFVDNKCKTILLSKGIRQHICDILEGGDTAFQIREKKYGYRN